MNSCDEHNDCIVVYTSRRGCPICNLQAELDEANKSLEEGKQE